VDVILAKVSGSESLVVCGGDGEAVKVLMV
jgi:hypothetical protein